jgi:ubiquinone biosynthesis protein
VREDLAAMAWIAPWLVGRIPVAALANPPALVELFAETIAEELDFRLEGQNMLDVAHVLHDAGQTGIVVPRPHPELVTRRVLVMERLEGFHYDDLAGMKAAGIETESMLRGLLISFLEGAMIYGVFHGDLHGGNLSVLPDGRVALYDFGMTGRMEEPQRLAFLRMMMTGAVNDVRGQLAAFRDLGALPADVDLDAMMQVLKVDEPVRDPTRMSGEELVHEIQDVIKGLLRHGARLPKHLMLYVKDMLFFDGSIARFAPDVNLFQEVARIYGYFAQKHGARIARDIGFDPARATIDLEGMKKSMGLENEVEELSHRELQQRRQVIRERLEEMAPKRRGSG